ncbi:hypothetical protein Taro_031390 [Colocasia esculenta]|uniref:Annexin n=1 Tax=Colocasia esculenta TaxID=4460 RepID=A0A843W6A2_COLES|nr:hypothetical protein [Colocasia esculenta]
MSTLRVPPVPTSARQDAVIDILARRDGTQRAFIQQEYRAMYSDDLTNRIRSELSGNFEKAVLLWMHDPAGRDATIVRQALSGDVIDPHIATEVICSRTPSQIQTFKQAYHAKFGAFLEHDIQYHASGDLLKLLLAYVRIIRYEGPEAVKGETSGTFEFGLLTILRCAENPAMYFAKLLRKAMKGLGTNDSALIRVVVTRTEIDMQYIKAEYHKKYKKTLGDAIHSETSGHYRNFLLALVGPGH